MEKIEDYLLKYDRLKKHAEHCSNIANQFAAVADYDGYRKWINEVEEAELKTKEALSKAIELAKAKDAGCAKWISTEDRWPTMNEEYLVIWDLKDNRHPVVTSMDYDTDKKCFTDPRADGAAVDNDCILYWQELPKPLKIEKKKYVTPLTPEIHTLEQMERLAYGQCIHGENLASCPTCNPELL